MAAATGAGNELTVDPRTDLEIIDIPAAHAKHFAGLKGSLIHWFGVVDKYNRMWKPQRRVAIFSDQSIFLCRLEGGVTRCLNVRNVQELVLSEQSAIGFRVGPPDYDMLIAVDSVEEREAIVSIVTKVYWALVGQELPIRKLSGDSGEAMQQKLQLNKPEDWVLKIEPIKSVKALTKLMLDKQKKEEEDRKVVEEEFGRIKEGLRLELQRYRTEEYDRMVDQLSQSVRALEDKDREIERLKRDTVSLDDPEVWKKCPNCTQFKRVLESNSNDDKQKILRLEREVESQRHIVEHLQAAIQFRSAAAGAKGAAGGGAGGEAGADSQQVTLLRQELADSTKKNKELQQVILESPYLTADVKQKASKIATAREGAGATGTLTGRDWQDVVGEKDREIRHLKSALRDATFRHVQELEAIRTQFQRYDNQIVEYLERVFSQQGQANAAGLAQQTANAARHSATGAAFDGAPPLRTAGGGFDQLRMDRQSPSVTSNPLGGGPAGAASPIATYGQLSSGAPATPRGMGGGASPSGLMPTPSYQQPYDFATPGGTSRQPNFAPPASQALPPFGASYGGGGAASPFGGRR